MIIGICKSKKDGETRIPPKTGVNSGAPEEGSAVPAPLVAPVV